MPRLSQSGRDIRSTRPGEPATLVPVTALDALLTGLLAGLGVAVPLGPVGLLVARAGAVAGLRRGLAAAGGVAVVDAGYAVVAATAGAGVSRVLAGHERVVAVVASVVLAGVAVHLLRGSRRPAPAAAPGPPDRSGPALATTARFVLLTAVNPLTLVTFAALAAALPPATPVAWFVAGVAGASAAWQCLLASAGSLVRHRAGAAARRWTGPVGAAAVLVAALVTLARAL
nr:LysE family transporter [Cellulomonas hominis]